MENKNDEEKKIIDYLERNGPIDDYSNLFDENEDIMIPYIEIPEKENPENNDNDVNNNVLNENNQNLNAEFFANNYDNADYKNKKNKSKKDGLFSWDIIQNKDVKDKLQLTSNLPGYSFGMKTYKPLGIKNDRKKKKLIMLIQKFQKLLKVE